MRNDCSREGGSIGDVIVVEAAESMIVVEAESACWAVRDSRVMIALQIECLEVVDNTLAGHDTLAWTNSFPGSL